MIHVSIHAPARGATLLQASENTPFVFQSTPPHGGRRPGDAEALQPACFNPRPRTGGDGQRRVVNVGSRVSIHAPARGATRTRNGYGYGMMFQSTPPHGGRRDQQTSPCPRSRFNPRPRTGGDSTGRKKRVALLVSIHAPARGATKRCVWCEWHVLFQSTPPHGGRLIGANEFTLLLCFNPRPRTGGDTFSITYCC